MSSVDRNTFVKTVMGNDWMKTPCNSIFPPNKYFCVIKGDFVECSSFEISMTPILTGDDTPFESFKKLGDKIVGNGYIILFTKDNEPPPCCLHIRFAKRCLRL